MELIPTIIAYTVVTLGAIGLCANFFAIFVTDMNDEINAEYLEMEKVKQLKNLP